MTTAGRVSWGAGLAAIALTMAACSGASADRNETVEGNGVSLRNLAEADVAVPKPAGFAIDGALVPTPSDKASRYFLVRERQAINGNIIAIVRQEHGDRVAYARAEISCADRQFHILGVGDRRATAETNIAYDGPLRSVDGLPLREELAAFACARNGTPLAKG